MTQSKTHVREERQASEGMLHFTLPLMAGHNGARQYTQLVQICLS